jgi:hypothetical protein
MQADSQHLSRFPYRPSAELICLPRLYRVTLIDISEHGVLVGATQSVGIAVGDEARLRLLTEKGNQAFELQARVAHRSGLDIGLEFVSIDRHARSTLRRMIEMNLGMPELASRSLPAMLHANLLAASTSPARV